MRRLHVVTASLPRRIVMLTAKVYQYALMSLEGTPAVFARLLSGLSETEADLRPDPDRFSLREAIAHLADWEDVFRQRMQLTLREDNPVLQGYDEGQWAIDHAYAQSDWREQLARFAEERAQTALLVRSFAPEQLARTGRHTEAGPISLQEQVLLITVHDGYHARQFAEYRA